MTHRESDRSGGAIETLRGSTEGKSAVRESAFAQNQGRVDD